MEEVKKLERIEQLKERRIEAVRLLGRYNRKIKQEFYEDSKKHLMKTMMVKILQSPQNKLGVTIPTNRLQHYADTAIIARKITRGLFPEDEDYAQGVGVIALYHDCGQDPFGHDGESAFNKASEGFNGGPRLHNIDGAMEIIFRKKSRIIKAIKEAIAEDIIKEESIKREISFKQLKRRVDLGMEIGLSKKIDDEIEKNKDLMEEAVWVMATGAGNHNGERGTADIEPDYGITNKAFYNQAIKTYFDREEDKRMKPCSMADAIVKISDQISSIPRDIIDAKRAEIEDIIFEGWAEPIAKILNIDIREAQNKLNGNEQELKLMVKELQEKLIESVIRSSTQEKIGMDLAPLMYGVTDKNGNLMISGLRTFNQGQHQAYTSTARSEQILDNIAIELTKKLSRLMLVGKKKIFPEKLNRLFRISEESPIRKQSEQALLEAFDGPEEYRDFYEYAIGISAEEYNMNKEIVKKKEISFFKSRILNTLKKQRALRDNTIERSSRRTTEYLIETYLLAPEFEGMKNSSDEEIKSMIIRINDYLSTHPVEGINRMNLEIERTEILHIGDNDFEIKVKEHLNTDEQIAARIAISYLERLDDRELVDLAYREGVLSKEDKEFLETPYSVLKPKDNDSPGYRTTSMDFTRDDYAEASTEVEK